MLLPSATRRRLRKLALQRQFPWWIILFVIVVNEFEASSQANHAGGITHGHAAGGDGTHHDRPWSNDSVITNRDFAQDQRVGPEMDPISDDRNSMKFTASDQKSTRLNSSH